MANHTLRLRRRARDQNQALFLHIVHHSAQCARNDQLPPLIVHCSHTFISSSTPFHLQTIESAPLFHNLTLNATTVMSAGHGHSASFSQNHKAQLANAYNELGKELASQKIRVVGNYTLGKVIGEGVFPLRC